MIQAQSTTPSQSLRQTLKPSPKLIAGQNMLGLSKPEVEKETQELVEENPCAELDAEQGERRTTEGWPDRSADMPQERTEPTREAVEAKRFANQQRLDTEYGGENGDRPHRRALSRQSECDGKTFALANQAGRPLSMYENLHEQWRFAEVGPQIRHAGELILEHIEEDGYLRTALEELAARGQPALTVEALEEALGVVQRTLDPPGIGARAPQECYLIQLNRFPEDHKLERVLVEQYFTDILKNRFPAIAKHLGIDLEEVEQAVSRIKKLDRHPARRLEMSEAQHVRVDVVVTTGEDPGDYLIQLTRTTADRIGLSRFYKDLAEELKKKGGLGSDEDKKALDYIEKHLEAIEQFRTAYTYRKDRLEEVVKAIVRRQLLFLEYGLSALEPMRMADLAAELGCDESTISRAVRGKAIQTPQGIFQLRRLFSNGCESVKMQIRQLIEEEDPHRPLSDSKIVECLNAQGIDVGRRTVVKYRQKLGIAHSRLRKRF